MNSPYIGGDIETHDDVFISTKAHTLSTYIIGRSGSGKSRVMAEMIASDMNNNEGVVLFDPPGTLVEEVLEQVPQESSGQVLLLNCRDSERTFGFNLFDCADPRDSRAVSFTVGQFVSTFRHVWHEAWGARLEALLRNIAYVAIENPGFTLAEAPRLLDDATYRKRLVSHLTNPISRAFWERFEKLTPHQKSERTESTMVRIDAFLSDPVVRAIVGQETTIDFEKIGKGWRIVLVDLGTGAISEDAISLIGSSLVNRLVGELQWRNSPEPVIHLYADEVQRFISPVFTTAYNEMRKFGLAVTSASQNLSQLSYEQRSAMLGANTLIAFSLGGEGDARVLAEKFRAEPEYPEMLPAGDPWLEMQRGRGREPGVRHAYEAVLQELEYIKRVAEWKTSWGGVWDSGGQSSMYVDKREVDTALEIIAEAIRKFLMAAPSVNILEREVLLLRVGEATSTALRNLPVWWNTERERFRDSYAKHEGIVIPALHQAVRQLAAALDISPIPAPEWEAAQVNGPKRGVTEIYNEHINQLATLPAYEAWVSIGESGSRHEYHMETYAPSQPLDDIDETLEEINQNYWNYTRDRNEVLEEIDARYDEPEVGVEEPETPQIGVGELEEPVKSWRRRIPIDE